MSNTKNTTSRVAMVCSAVVLSFASAASFLPKAFADGPEDKIDVIPDVDIYGGPFTYTGEQICPSRLLVTADVYGEDVILENGVDYSFECGENIAIGEDSGIINLFPVASSEYVFDDFSINFSIWEHLQDISYENSSVSKTYGDDDFTNPLTRTNVHGDITYSSSDEDVAIVDWETGEVSILASGDTVITAIAEAADGYGEVVASYTLTVDKKAISIVSAEAGDKIYDGTNKAEINGIELDDDELVYGSDFEAVGTFEDANVGVDKNVNITLRLSNDAAKRYNIDGVSYSAAASIDAYEFYGDEGELSSDSFIYSGRENKPTVRIPISLNGISDTYLVEGRDFTATYPDDMVNVGEKTISISGINNFTGDFDLFYDIENYDILASNVALAYTITDYDGTAKEPGVTVKIGDFVVDPSEYTVEYQDNVEKGTATVEVTANDDANISGFVTKTFEITGKNILNISGIANQSVAYTGSPVNLAGNLSVGNNTDGITVDDLTVTWYDEDGAFEIDRPTEVGSYVVKYSYDGLNYMGDLTVEFHITKAESPIPAEMTAGLRVETGDFLYATEDDLTDGFHWVNYNTAVEAGSHTYPATYTYNDDEDNYTTLSLEVPVYGYSVNNVYVDIDTLGADAEYPDEAIEGEQVEIKFLVEAGYEFKQVLLNGEDVTAQIKDNKLVLTAGTTDIDVLASFRKVYNVIEGAGVDYIFGEGKLASFRIDADYELFTNGGKLYVDDILVGEGYYTHAPGSTIITLSDEFVKLLGDGAHTMSVVFSDGGVARTNFTVENSGSVENKFKSGVTPSNQSKVVVGP